MAFQILFWQQDFGGWMCFKIHFFFIKQPEEPEKMHWSVILSFNKVHSSAFLI